eukprot:TRINITY_DN36523_c0_g1_i2.p1 TRINITY_DN36523_c0_g1~~TRINITY_DN36523_c0_g1_i2.p1  ORF type:complete len:140 (-),score=33.34 TRINITY_DN36523_c0_g1_i2:253-672(-)
MFQKDGHHTERAFLNARKGVVKVAMKAGVPIVPVYCFGHSELWRLCVDPFGVLEWISAKSNIAFIFFFGRFWWPFGPPRRTPVTMVCGKPVVLGDNGPEEAPSQERIEQGHARMVAEFQRVFDIHKSACGYADKELKIV